MSDRIISFDILRGWAILGNLMIHTFMLVSQIEGIAETDPANLPWYGFIFMSLVIVFGHWRGLFLLISAAIHMYMMQKKFKSGLSREVILFQEILKGIVLWIWAMFFYVFLAQWQISKSWVEQQPIHLEWRKIYHADQFANIAFAIILSAIIFYILSSSEKLRKPVVSSIVFGLVGLAFIFPAQAIYQAANNFWGIDFHNELGVIPEYLQNIGDKGWWDYIVRFFANQATGRESPLFPHFAYSAVGSIFGIFLSQGIPNKKKFLSWGFGFAGFCMVFSVFWLFVIEKIPEDPFSLVTFHVHPTWFTFLTIGMLLMVVLGFLARHEFNSKVNWEKRLKRSRFSRRVGVFSLTVYSLASIQAVLRVLLYYIFQIFSYDPGFRTPFGLNIGWTIFLIALEILMWFGITWAWEKGHFIGSIDWLFSLALKAPFQIRKQNKKPIFGDFMDVQGKVIEPTPISWVEPAKDIEVIEKEEESIPIEGVEIQPVS